MSSSAPPENPGRRAVLKATGAIATLMAFRAWGGEGSQGEFATAAGWERQPTRWFQLAFTEDDPGNFDPDFWLRYFLDIRADGVCLSAGGGIAFYPTRIPYHGRARGLGDRDPFGDMVARCKSHGINVVARIDPHAMSHQAYHVHPEWAAAAPDGTARRHPTAPDFYYTCALGDFGFEFTTSVIEEVSATYPVDAIFGNRWFGYRPCYCTNCRTLYRAATGRELPLNVNPSEPEGRRYISWSNDRLLTLIDVWNGVIKKHRANAFFIPGTERRSFIDFDGEKLGQRLPLVFADRQSRSMGQQHWSPGSRVWNSGRFAKELHAFMGDKPVGNIISVGIEESYRWKDSVQAEAEIRIWTAGAIAHGSRPWITKFNAKPFDRRWMPVVADIFRWHNANERYLRNEQSLARVAIVLSTRTGPILGGEERRQELEDHYHGFYQALLESRIVFDLLDDAFLGSERVSRYRLLIFPNAAVMSDTQCDAIRDYVNGGGCIVATHETSLYDEDGRQREDFGLADLFGCHYAGKTEQRVQNSYLTLRHPHPALTGMEDVSRTIGAVKRVHVREDGVSTVPLTLVPSYPDLPMERVYTDQPTSDIPMAFCRTTGRGRVVYLPMDLDRTFEELAHGDHLSLLNGLVRWAADERQPIEITGPGMIDIAYWRQKESVAAHLVNFNNAHAMRGSYREAIRTGPYRVDLALPQGRSAASVRLLEANREVAGSMVEGRLRVEVPEITFHEVVAVDLI